MEYTFSKIKKEFANAASVGKTEDILKSCKVATKYQKILDNGTPEEQYELGDCLTKTNGILKIETVMLALPLFYKAANHGHAESQFQMFYYLDEDKHKDAILYLKMAVENGHSRAQLIFFNKYLNKRVGYATEQKTFKNILKEFEKSADERTLVRTGLYYERVEKDYKKTNVFKNQVERLEMVLKEQENPSKALREEIVKMFPKYYKFVGNKMVRKP